MPTGTSCRPAARSPSTATGSRPASRRPSRPNHWSRSPRGEVTHLPPEDQGLSIVATGPLTSTALAQDIRRVGGEAELAFFDAIAPIVHKDSIDLEVAWFQSRYDKPGPGGGVADYINCPLRRDEYDAFLAALLEAPKVEFKDWEAATPYFEGCLPIEVMAGRGRDTLRFGPMKPVGLTDPRTGRRPHAVAQLRQDNALGTLYNMVGFQTKLRHAEQVRILRMIPGLGRAEFARLGGLHRNTFINSPRLLDPTLRLRPAPWVRFAGQITGCEGYVESAAIGLLAGRFAAAETMGRNLVPPPAETAHGALLAHLTGGATAATFQPMNVNFGLFPSLSGEVAKNERKPAMARRALEAIQGWESSVDYASGRSCQSRQVG